MDDDEASLAKHPLPEILPPCAYGLHVPGKQGKAGKEQEEPAHSVEPVHEDGGFCVAASSYMAPY